MPNRENRDGDADGSFLVCELLLPSRCAVGAPKHAVRDGGYFGKRQYRSQPFLGTLELGIDGVELVCDGDDIRGHIAPVIIITWTIIIIIIGAGEFVRSGRSAGCSPEFESGLRGVILDARPLSTGSANQLPSEPTPGDQCRSSSRTGWVCALC